MVGAHSPPPPALTFDPACLCPPPRSLAPHPACLFELGPPLESRRVLFCLCGSLCFMRCTPRESLTPPLWLYPAPPPKMEPPGVCFSPPPLVAASPPPSPGQCPGRGASTTSGRSGGPPRPSGAPSRGTPSTVRWITTPPPPPADRSQRCRMLLLRRWSVVWVANCISDHNNTTAAR